MEMCNKVLLRIKLKKNKTYKTKVIPKSRDIALSMTDN